MDVNQDIRMVVIAERLCTRQLIVQCSHIASVLCVSVKLIFQHTLIVWGQFLRSRPQTAGMRVGGACTRVGTTVWTFASQLFLCLQ